MALSLTDNYNLTRDQIIKAAFETIGVAVTNEPLDPDDVQVGKVALNALAMSWKSYGMMLWKRTVSTANPLTQGTIEYDVGDDISVGGDDEKPMKMISVSYKNTTSGTETPMTRLSYKEYDDLPNKALEATPTQYYFEPQRTGSIVKIWPTADANAAANLTIEYTYQAPIQSMPAGTDDIDFPNEWYRALILNLASDLAPRYGLQMKEREMLAIQAMDALDLAKNFDVEDASLYLMPHENY